MNTDERAVSLALLNYERREEKYEKHVFKGESEFQTYVLRRLRAIPTITLKSFKVMKANENGVSDIILCINGKFVAIELKHKGNKPTPMQVDFIKDIRSSGGIGECAWVWGDVKAILLKAGFDIDSYEREKIKEEKRKVGQTI